ncbi:MAG: undecaprenyldiphospho-muramoylpentapeptide beta-N-acetylglucosaminyltransferase [Candidatus Binatia bacterium]
MRLAFAGGGTGGHLFPGLAVAQCARERGLAESIVFFGAERGIESRLVVPAGFELVTQPLEAVSGRSALAALKAVGRLLGAAAAARKELVQRRCEVVIGLGGYASASAVLAARTAGIPAVLLEQNSAPGLANRALSRLAAAVCTSFEQSVVSFPRGRVRFTGNPLRPGLEELAERGARDTLLVFGGSAGAVSINRAVVNALAALRTEAALPPVLHQTGDRGLDDTRRAYREAGIEAEVVPFIDDMVSAYARARLVVCRAGATTVAELLAVGRPSVLVPYPHAAGDHQTRNARSLESLGAAVVIADDDRSAEGLRAELGRLLGDRETLDSMATKAAAAHRPGAAARVLEILEEVVGP